MTTKKRKRRGKGTADPAPPAADGPAYVVRDGRLEEVVLPPKQQLDNGHVVAVASDRGGRELRARPYAFPLQVYLSRGQISGAQFLAGCRLAHHYRASREDARYVLMRYGRVAGGEFEAERVEANAQAFRAAMSAIRGMPERGLAFSVCCVDEYAGRGNLHRVTAALDDLHRHFKG